MELYYEERGSGFPLLLLHGNGEEHGYFAAQLTYFSRHFRVIAVDTRGHGRSPRGDGPFTLVRFADDLHAFLLEKGIRRLHLLGFSDGANIALLFALRHGEMVEKLVLNGGNLSPAGIRPAVQFPIVLGYHCARFFARFSREAQRRAELLGLMVNEPDIPPEALHSLAVPTLVIAGTKDMVRRRHSELMAASLPCGQLALLPGDHFIANRQPAAFNAAVEGFLCGSADCAPPQHP